MFSCVSALAGVLTQPFLQVDGYRLRYRDRMSDKYGSESWGGILLMIGGGLVVASVFPVIGGLAMLGGFVYAVIKLFNW